MTLGGRLKHLAHVEDRWLNQVFAGNPDPEPWASADWKDDGDRERHTAALDSPEGLRNLLDRTVAVSDGILVHLIEEYSRHNGHADLIRESIDGVVGE